MLAPQGFRPGLRTNAPIRGPKTGQPAVLVAAERRPCVAQGGSPGQRVGLQSETIAPQNFRPGLRTNAPIRGLKTRRRQAPAAYQNTVLIMDKS